MVKTLRPPLPEYNIWIGYDPYPTEPAVGLRVGRIDRISGCIHLVDEWTGEEWINIYED